MISARGFALIVTIQLSLIAWVWLIQVISAYF